jgi:hypothetical protein
MTLGIVRVNWSGTSGGPGLTQLCIDDGSGGAWSTSSAQSAVDSVRSMFGSVQSYLPNELTIAVQPTVDQYDVSTGWLINTTQAPTAPNLMLGSFSGQWAGATGWRWDWHTGAIRNGRRVVGHTYMVPAGGIYDSSGGVTGIARTNILNAAGTFLGSLASAGLSLRVWSRPQVIGQPGGVSTAVTNAQMTGKTAVLRTRRD